MRASRTVVLPPLRSSMATALLAATAVLAGCQPPPTPPPAPAPTPMVPTESQVAIAQQQMATQNPNVRVGRVVSVDVPNHFAAVTGIPTTDVKVGDTISFTGPDHNPFANGTIYSVDESSPQFKFLLVDYSKGSTNGRDPAKGDLAIIVPQR